MHTLKSINIRTYILTDIKLYVRDVRSKIMIDFSIVHRGDNKKKNNDLPSPISHKQPVQKKHWKFFYKKIIVYSKVSVFRFRHLY